MKGEVSRALPIHLLFLLLARHPRILYLSVSGFDAMLIGRPIEIAILHHET
jgi:hypothetical protein